MQPIALLIPSICIWVLIHLWLLPLSKDRWQASDIRQKIARSGSLVVLEKIRDLSAIGAITISAGLLLVWLLGILSVGSFAAPKALIEFTASSYAQVKAWSEGYAGTIGIIGLIGAAISLYFSARYARKRISEIGRAHV